MTVAKSVTLFVLAAIAEIGGAWLIWQGTRAHRGPAWIGGGIAALAAYGFVATLQPDTQFGRILAAYGGVLSPDRWHGEWRWTAFAPTDGT
jgi:small multidrug resistance family-3 protein